jgi:hypothetical protein
VPRYHGDCRRQICKWNHQRALCQFKRKPKQERRNTTNEEQHKGKMEGEPKRSELHGVYKHIKTNHLYEVIGIGKAVTNVGSDFVIYKQLYAGTLKGTDLPMPIGSIWIREKFDFECKFVKA